MWLFSIKSGMSLIARLVVRGDHVNRESTITQRMCIVVMQRPPPSRFCLHHLRCMILRGGNLVDAHLVTPGSKDFVLCMATSEGFVTSPGIVLQVLGNLYGLPSSGWNFSKAVNVIVLKLGYKNTPYDPKFFCKWIDGMPALVIFHSDDFR